MQIIKIYWLRWQIRQKLVRSVRQSFNEWNLKVSKGDDYDKFPIRLFYFFFFGVKKCISHPSAEHTLSLLENLFLIVRMNI